MRIKELGDKIKKILNKDVSKFLNKHKILLASMGLVFLLACIGLIVTYAFYQVVDTTPVIGASTSNIPDIDIRIMAEERDTNGNGVGSYDTYPYIPKAGYKYNSTKSYCTNGSIITYNQSAHDVDITSSGHDVCYLYFDSIASLDITLEVYAENIDSDGIGTGEYTKLETTKLPSLGYEFNNVKSYCVYADSPKTHVTDTTVAYNALENNFTVNASKKGAICKAYMDAIDVDIQLKIYIQAKSGSSLYYEAEKIPTNVFYNLNNTKSACTGSSTMSIKNQKINIAATSKTSCVAYLDVGSGPILESMQSEITGVDVKLDLTNSTAGVTPTTYYYSSNGGTSYISSTSPSYTFTDLTPFTSYTFKAYSVDSSGNQSGILTVTKDITYAYNGIFEYLESVQTVNIVVSGYYKLQVWGAQGGSFDTTYLGGKGGYSEGIVHLNKGDTLYVYTGGQPTTYNESATKANTNAGGYNGGGAGRTYYYSSVYTYGMGGGGATDIRINTDDLYNRVIVAGGGSGSTNGTNGYAGGGTSSLGYSSSYIATQTSAGTGGSFGTGGASSGTYNYKYGAPGGGGGWYGGGAGTGQSDSSTTYRQYSGGGSGFVYTGQTVTVPSSGTYGVTSDYTLTSTTISDGTTTFTSPLGVSETGHAGNGYALVTFLGVELE